ncbi:MAG: diguanylate cyclase [Planctomycetota bacterium]|nr:diguanylate cyclase [Planctomycetota bacterium]
MEDLDTTVWILLMGEASPALTSSLGQAGWHVQTAGDEVEALTAVRNEPIDLVLLSLPVEEMVSEDLPNVLRRVYPGSYLPVMIMASGPAEEQRCRFLHSGADDVVCVSTGPAEVVARAGALLRIKRLHDQLSASHEALQQSLSRERKLLRQLRHDNEQLQRLATTDALTHVQNQRSFQDILAHQFRTAKRYAHHLSLLTLDVDFFKTVNDVHGHPSGDYVLKELAQIFLHSVRESDVVCRTGGEEFSVILPEADARQAQAFAERIRAQTAAREFIVYGQAIRVTVSIGAATFPTDVEITDTGMLVWFSDRALLQAKQTGRNRVVACGDLPPAQRAAWRGEYLVGDQALKADGQSLLTTQPSQSGLRAEQTARP